MRTIDIPIQFNDGRDDAHGSKILKTFIIIFSFMRFLSVWLSDSFGFV